MAQRHAATGHLFQAFSLLVCCVLCSADILWAWGGGGGGLGLEWELEELNGFAMLEG